VPGGFRRLLGLLLWFLLARAAFGQIGAIEAAGAALLPSGGIFPLLARLAGQDDPGEARAVPMVV
jgi:hypothetical protein